MIMNSLFRIQIRKDKNDHKNANLNDGWTQNMLITCWIIGKYQSELIE